MSGMKKTSKPTTSTNAPPGAWRQVCEYETDESNNSDDSIDCDQFEENKNNTLPSPTPANPKKRKRACRNLKFESPNDSEEDCNMDICDESPGLSAQQSEILGQKQNEEIPGLKKLPESPESRRDPIEPKRKMAEVDMTPTQQ